MYLWGLKILNVTISINGNVLYSRSVRNTGEKDTLGRTKYNCDDGTDIRHYEEDGAVTLAKMMLDTIKEI